jgi:hypothetical protein
LTVDDFQLSPAVPNITCKVRLDGYRSTLTKLRWLIGPRYFGGDRAITTVFRMTLSWPTPAATVFPNPLQRVSAPCLSREFSATADVVWEAYNRPRRVRRTA